MNANLDISAMKLLQHEASPLFPAQGLAIAYTGVVTSELSLQCCPVILKVHSAAIRQWRRMEQYCSLEHAGKLLLCLL